MLYHYTAIIVFFPFFLCDIEKKTIGATVLQLSVITRPINTDLGHQID
jgi:hypothetical protein